MQVYADDLLIMVEGQSRSRFEACAAECLRIVGKWGSSVGSNLAINKRLTCHAHGFSMRNRLNTWA